MRFNCPCCKKIIHDHPVKHYTLNHPDELERRFTAVEIEDMISAAFGPSPPLFAIKKNKIITMILTATDFLAKVIFPGR